MGDAYAVLALVLLLCAVICRWPQLLRALHPPRLRRLVQQRAARRFDREMCRRWGNDPIPRWHHDERERARAMRLARAHDEHS